MATPAHLGVSGAPPRIQRLAGQSAGQTGAGAPASVDQALASPGRPLEPALRRDLEERFGYDFSRVRVHSGAAAEQSARDLNAKAYTVGHNMVFGNGHYAPQTTEGQRLLAHELAHVVQQGAVGPRAGGVRNLPISAPGDVHERFADGVAAARKSLGSRLPMDRTTLKLGVAGLMLQRQAIDPRALETETIDTPRHLRVSQWLVETSPGGGSKRTELYWVDFEVDSKGVMTASVRTVLADRKYRSGLLRFGERFRNALQRFQANGVEVNAFEGDWSYMTADEISDNLRVFREEMEQGGTREEAARRTPTGKVATSSGFELTSVENVPESQPHLAEEGVRRWRVKAIFRRQLPSVTPSGGGSAKAVTSTAGTATTKTTPATEAQTTGEAKIGAGGATHTTIAKPAGSVPLEGPPPVTARDLDVEMRETETTNRRMASAATFARYALEAYNFLGVLEQIAAALNLATATLAGGPLQKEKQQAVAAVASATELADYYESLDLRKNIPPGGWAAWDGGWYALQQIQFNYYETESHMHDALESVDAALKNIGRQIQDLADAATKKTSALVLTPVSTPYADAYLFADAAGQLRSHLIDAANAYARAHRAIYFSERMAQASIKFIEIRLRQLGAGGLVNLDIDTDDLKTAPLDKFTERQ